MNAPKISDGLFLCRTTVSARFAVIYQNPIVYQKTAVVVSAKTANMFDRPSESIDTLALYAPQPRYELEHPPASRIRQKNRAIGLPPPHRPPRRHSAALY
ncbi:hypothetical protein [Neisseria zalophi]|uniref:hypothetical protein n=1 Tax=Neisseria zalophi TaxID=640030 RepID=UPI001784D947|nr:hypothetical protein [Neisseria zalophi]